MELKNYQEAVLDRLSFYLKTLKEKRENALDLVKIVENRGRSAQWDSEDFNFCSRAWEELNKKGLIPKISKKVIDKIEALAFPKSQQAVPALYKSRISGLRRPVPNICLKVPTGGGKTLLGASSVERINTDFFERNNGLVLWVVPSDSIYRQTLKALSDRESLYRQTLDRASARKVKILQKTGSFQPSDVENFLCVMLLMLQSAGRQSKETLRIFRDSGKFPYFFPEADDYHGSQKLIEACPNLDTYKTSAADCAGGLKKTALKHSLGNVLKLAQPLIVIDEGHRAYSEKAKAALMDFNPRFILELSATPNKKSHESNVLVSVSGGELKKEEMIKLPINIYNLESGDWKKALAKGHEILQRLSKSAVKAQAKDSRYIRPIQLIRVERTGKDQREKKFIHSEDVREYLIRNFNVNPLEIKVKSASKDELKNEDLLSEYSRVRYIITKEALKEGWDCPFAYILTILSKTKAPVAIEQMIGRVLRQPETRRASIEALNQSYVVCMDQDTNQAVEGIRKGLENEGMDGLAGEIKMSDDHKASVREAAVRRRKPFRGLKIFLPKVLCKKGGSLKELSYEEDLLFSIDWSKLKLNQTPILDGKIPDISHTQVDIKKQLELISSFHGSEKEEAPENFNMDFGFLCARLSDIIPNLWDAGAAVDKALSSLKRKYGKERVYLSRFYILDFLRNNLQEQISQRTEKLFREKLKNHEIIFKLVSAGDPDLNWKMAETLPLSVSEESDMLRKRNSKDLQLSLFEDIYKKEFKFNDLEKKVAWYLDEDSAIKWWHRIIERQDWHLQGWQKNKIYPDFLVCVKPSKSGNASFSILETKGRHLMGNPDTEYKRKLFDLFTEYSKKSIDAGTIEIQDQKMTFDLILQNEWREALNRVFRTRQ